MATTFVDVLKQELPQFAPNPFYEPITDSLLMYIRDERSYAKRISKHFTIFVSNSDDTLVGFEIKGVTDICKAIGSDGLRQIVGPLAIEDEDGPCELFIMVKVATIASEVPLNGSEYESLEQAAKGRTFCRDQLQTCG